MQSCSLKSTEESMLFNIMTPWAKEPLPQFHSRLMAQAKKYHFRCSDCPGSFQPRMIRDRLILFVEISLRKKILSKYHDPTAEEILQMYQENQLLSIPSLSNSLSELTLASLEKITQTVPNQREAIKSHLTKGAQELVIDEDTVWKFPIAQNSALYSKYATCATSIVIDGVHDFDMDPLVKLFPNITGLTLRNVQMDTMSRRGTIVTCPRKVRQFRVINSKLHLDMLISWLEEMHALDELYFEGTDSVYLNTLPRVSVLTLLVPNVIRSGFSCPQLKRLTLDHCWNGLTDDQIKGFTRLEHLKVVRSVDWKAKEQIEAMKLKSVDVHYLDIPKEQNLILRLNTDCLMQLQRYLSANDWMAFHESHPRLQQLPIRSYRIYEPSSFRTQIVKTSPNFYKRIGPLVASLYVGYLQSYSLQELMAFFTNVRHLELDNTYIEDCDLGHLTRLRTLVLVLPSRPGDPTALFRSVKTTLESLEVEIEPDDFGQVRQIKGLEELQNLKEFIIADMKVTKNFIRFLRTNQGHMRKLSFYITHCPPALEKELWQVIANMPNLQELSIGLPDNGGMIPRIPDGSLPLLEKLTIFAQENAQGKGYEQLLRSLDCSKIKSFKFDGSGWEFGPDINVRMKCLEDLTMVDRTGEQWPNHVKNLCALGGTLKKISISLQDQQALPLIKGLPLLNKLNTAEEQKLGVRALQEIRKYLKEVNRKLCINSINY